jgi:KipI family sensor histidine kinase inhibitor
MLLRTEPYSRYVEDVVPAAASILLTARKADDIGRLRSAIEHLVTLAAGGAEPVPPQRILQIPVIYNGPDLDDVAQRCGLTPEEVVVAHTGSAHYVAFFGFAPGFAYIKGLSAALHLPRRDNPRTNVEAGCVAIAADQTVVYPGGTPGGWHLIGRTTTRLWDLTRNPPAKLNIGDRVAFTAVATAA